MPPGRRGGGGKIGRTKQESPAIGPRRGKDTSPLPTPMIRTYQRRKKQQSLPEGPLMEILSRVPYRSLCRFKSVSKSWLDLCSNLETRMTLSGFFHNHFDGGDLKFRNLSGRGAPMVDPALPFLPRYEGFKLEQCCGGLLLCRCWESLAEEDECDLVVCNPATQQWTVLPPIEFLDEEDSDPAVCSESADGYLGFDKAIPSRFVVFVPLLGCLNNAAIYSSEAGRWIRCGWEDMPVPIVTAECVFLNGFMHLVIEGPEIAALDTKREVWTTIPLPGDMEPSNGMTSMGHSQGLLHAWYIDPDKENQLSVWVMEDYGSDIWTLKHTVSVPELFHAEDEDGFYEMFAIHPERNLIFITNGEDMTLSYDMDSQKVDVMCTSGEFLGGLPYVPCFVEWLPDGH